MLAFVVCHPTAHGLLIVSFERAEAAAPASKSLTKDYDSVAIISRRAAEAAGLDVSDRELHDAPLKGRAEPVQFYALKTLADLAI